MRPASAEANRIVVGFSFYFMTPTGKPRKKRVRVCVHTNIIVVTCPRRPFQRRHRRGDVVTPIDTACFYETQQ